jgi:5-methylcytosine-specific restriction endonuclease McrA
MGGTKTKDSIENLMALCRQCHVQYGDIADLKEYLKKIHKLRLDIRL